MTDTKEQSKEQSEKQTESNLRFSQDGQVQYLESEDGTRIYRIEAPVLPWFQGYIYILKGANIETTMIDAGCGEGECSAAIEQGFETINREFEAFSAAQIRRIILTHAHIDHFGGVQEWKRRSGAEIWMHQIESRTVSSYNERAVAMNVRFVNMLRLGGAPEELIPDIVHHFGFIPGRIFSSNVEHPLQGGETADNLQFHYLPGHSSGHLATQLGSYLFSGDLVLSKTLTQIWPESVIPHTGLSHYLESLTRLKELALEHEKKSGRKLTVLPAHEALIFDLPARIELVLKSEERRNKRLLDVLRREGSPMTFYQIFKRLYLVTHINRTLFALCDIAARMEYLQQQGHVALANYDSIDWMNPVAFQYTSCDDSL